MENTLTPEDVRQQPRSARDTSADPGTVDGLSTLNGLGNTNSRRPVNDMPSPVHPINGRVAQLLREGADLLERQGSDGYRERAYRAAANTLERLPRRVDRILVREGRPGLVALPTIGTGIAAAIAEIVVTGRWSRLDRLQGEHDPERLFQTVPGVGQALSKRFTHELGLETLDELEQAVRSPETRLQGLGPRRREAIAAVLAARLGHLPATVSTYPSHPSQTLVLEIDTIYRIAAAAGSLPHVLAGAAEPALTECVPVLHRRLDGWDFSAMYSTTLHARQAGRERDWVVVHYQRDGHPEGRCTVVGSRQGETQGRRVVLGLGD